MEATEDQINEIDRAAFVAAIDIMRASTGDDGYPSARSILRALDAAWRTQKNESNRLGIDRIEGSSIEEIVASAYLVQSFFPEEYREAAPVSVGGQSLLRFAAAMRIASLIGDLAGWVDVLHNDTVAMYVCQYDEAVSVFDAIGDTHR